ncbi:hypothetical protein JD844_015331 [Phrynosoma platyrhinos]|uniref:Dystrophin n=1 Tax=Phrynosoma platyrhinos TaxID=52577 RepID=A0ABQ7SIW0_PHRPL|nr:hypothetical protein JD844_015331 [Phrynosoma platyrhinos]
MECSLFCPLQVQEISLEVTELLQWLEHVELQLFFSKPTWGQPEATKDKLAAHLELCKEMDSKQQTYNRVRKEVQHLLANTSCPRASSTEHSLSILEQKWGSVATQLQERKEQLSEGLMVTREFHSTIQELLMWVGGMEETLGTLPPPSYLLDSITKQIQEHKVSLSPPRSLAHTPAL